MNKSTHNISDIYLVKHNSNKFSPNTLVKYIACSYSGDCFLCASIDDDLNREWIMYYDLYPLEKSKLYDFNRWYYDANYEATGLELFQKYM